MIDETGVSETRTLKEKGVTDPIIIEGMTPVTCSVIPKAGSVAKLQYTTSKREAIADGTANWIDWPYGMVAFPRSDGVLLPIMAVRMSCNGAATMEVLG